MADKKRFNWIAFWLLGAVTCGIYPLYVWYTMTETNNELAAKYGEDKIMNFLLATLVLAPITCGIYSYIWIYKFMKLQVAVAEKSGVEVAPSKNPIVLLLLSFVPIYSFYVLCDNYNRTLDAN